MTLIKIVGKRCNLRIRFEHPIHLREDKTYKLALLKASFADLCTQNIENFMFRYSIIQDDTKYATETYTIEQLCSIDSLKKYFITYLKSGVKDIIQKIRLCKKTVPKALERIDYSHLKIDIKSTANTIHTIQFKTPLKIDIVSAGNFCELLGFKMSAIKDGFQPDTVYTSSINPPILKPIELLEIHTNITAFSFANHSENPHIHDMHELLYVCHFDKPFLPGVSYVESPNQRVYVPLREGIRKISDIEVQLKDMDNSLVTEIDKVVIYLHLSDSGGIV